MSQTKNESFIEVLCNVISGMLTAWLCWDYIIIAWTKLYQVDTNHLTFVEIMLVNFVFTIVSVVRSYFWRRLFNKKGGESCAA